MVAAVRGIWSTNSTVFGTLYAGQPGLRVSDHVALGQRRRTLGELNHRVHAAAPLAVGEPDDDDIGDAVVFDERAFHFGGKDIGPAGDDHVAAAIGDVEIAVVIEMTDVTGSPEAVRCRGQQRRTAEIVVSRAHR